MSAFHVIEIKIRGIKGNKNSLSLQLAFHGIGDRGLPRDQWPISFLGHPAAPTLEIDRIGWNVPAICSPEYCLVVSSVVERIMADYPGMEFKPVSFRKLVDAPLESSFRERDERSWLREQTRFRDLPDVPAYHESVPQYFEVVVARHRDISARYSKAKRAMISLYRGVDDSIEQVCSDRLFAEFPCHWNGGVYVFSDDLFRKVERFFDWEYYIHQEYHY